MKYLKKFEEVSLAHGFSGGSGAPMFGIDGPNYGQQQLPPTISKQDTSFLYSEITDEYYSNDEIQKIFNDYQIWCRENQEEPIITQISDLTASSFAQILLSLKNPS